MNAPRAPQWHFQGRAQPWPDSYSSMPYLQRNGPDSHTTALTSSRSADVEAQLRLRRYGESPLRGYAGASRKQNLALGYEAELLLLEPKYIGTGERMWAGPGKKPVSLPNRPRDRIVAHCTGPAFSAEMKRVQNIRQRAQSARGHRAQGPFH